MPRFAGRGTIIEVEDTEGSATFSSLECAISADGPTASTPELEATCMEDAARVYLADLPDSGTIGISFNVNFQSTNIQRIFTDFDGGVSRNYRIVFSDNLSTLPGSPAAGTIFAFRAFVQEAPVSTGVGAVTQMNATLRIQGAVTRTFGA